MRKISLFITLLGLGTLHAQTSKEVTSEITDVTVYLNGAQVTREAEVSIPSGRTELLFKGITPNLNPSSLQVATGKDVTILSVNHSIDYLNSAKTDAMAEKLVKRREELEDSMALNKNTREVFLQERKMLISNQSIGGQEKGVDVEQLIRASNFFRERLTEIEKTLFTNHQETMEMKQRLDKINRQLRELNAQEDQPTSTIKVSVSTKISVDTPFELIYTIRDARWQPFYDIRVNDSDEPISLVYNAKVYQNSQEEWENVNLTLSTGNPSISNYKPELNKWYIYSGSMPPPRVTSAMNIIEDDVELEEELIIEDTEMAFIREEKPPKLAPKALAKEMVDIQQQQTTTSFKIDIPYTIPSDNQGYDVAVSDHQVETVYQYATVPKLSPHVYLIAQIPDWSELNLLPGRANIYFDQTYQGKTYLDPYTSKDTLALSIGRDPGIIVEREMQKDRSEKSLFGSTRKETKAWVITVRNTKNTEVSVEIEDQYPLSRSGEIKVELEEAGKADVNETEGKLTWNLDLKPGEVKELKFVYSVRYLKDMDVIIE